MKKNLLPILLIFTCFSSTTSAFYQDDMEYYENSIQAFIDSPSQDDLVNIENEAIRYCEQVYLEAYRRREFTLTETTLCGELFQEKQNQELNYMKFNSFGY